jgi:outer membrane protein assembly factor BamB
MMRRFLIAVAVLGSSCNFVFAAVENWPQWRGPLGTGVAPAGDYPVKFSNTEGVAWKAKLPGIGTSTPAVWGDRIFVTCGIKSEGDEGRDGVLCFDMNGKELWRHEFGEGRKGKSSHASGSNPSPVTDGKNLVVYFKTGTLANLGLDGKEKWKINLQDKFGKDTLWWDLGTSPILVGDRVVVAVMQSGDSYLVALDLKDGNVAWKEKRQYDVPKENDNSYCTPQLVRVNGKDQIIAWGADHLTGHDAQTGKLLWECRGFNPDNEQNLRTIASAVASDGVAVVPYARGGSLVAVRMGGDGDITKSALWDKHGRGQSTDVPTPVITDGKVYLLTDVGHIDCLKLKTGEVLWSADLPKNRNKYYASPVLAGDKLYCAREDGAVFVGQVSDAGYKELAANSMDERIIASLVPVRGGLLVRGDEYLYRIEASPSKEGR